jgi:energy-coupling factor transporter ATP-binding protein EcfA2
MNEAVPSPAAPVAAPLSVAPVIKPPRIKSFTLCDFRAFAGPEPVTFTLDGKNLLIYGENGAGKSSVFHALDEFFSVARRGPQARKETLLGLKNVFSGQPDTGLKISVEFDDGKPAAEWTTARHPVDVTPAADDRVKNAAYRKAILDYRSLLETNYRHGDGPVNLFDVCINVLLRDFEVLHDGRQRPIFDLWTDLLHLADVESRGRKRLGSTEKSKVLALLPLINQGLREAVAAVQPQIDPLLKALRWKDLDGIVLDVPGLTYNDDVTIPPLARIQTREISINMSFRSQPIGRPHLFLNEARLSAFALAIYLAGRKVCAATLQADTPRLIVLDDVLIGLDQSNRLPVIDLLADQFKDWQIVLLTHDRVWFEMARAYQRRHNADKFWNYAKIHSDDDPTKAPVVSLATSSAAADLITDGRNFLKQGHVNAAGNYARIAVELALREFCETKKVLVAYQQLPDKTPASVLLTAAKEFSRTKANGTYDVPLSTIDMYTSILFNKLSHGGVPAVTSHEVQGALNAVAGLLFALKVVPTGTKAPSP